MGGELVRSAIRLPFNVGAPLRACAAVWFSLTAVAMIAGCAAPNSYMGIDISADALARPAEHAAGAPNRAAEKPAIFYDPEATFNCLLLAEQGKPTPQCAQLLGRTSPMRDVPLGILARSAWAGNKQAQLELGIRFEEGRGVTQDPGRARKLYAKAARDSGGTIWVYTPPVGNGTKGRVIPVNTGPKQSGLAEAKRRLEGAE